MIADYSKRFLVVFVFALVVGFVFLFLSLSTLASEESSSETAEEECLCRENEKIVERVKL
ncbi:hypothetical protein ACFPU1_15600 [Thalassorhabdus alkalitolerans]|uniref:Transmembrane protein n=1 Tax=Thalassorhabdus alkalitolerans TaxID=2282697 RepID=A0ABW0YNX7_9BACI